MAASPRAEHQRHRPASPAGEVLLRLTRGGAVAAALLLAGCASQPPARVADNFCTSRIQRHVAAIPDTPVAPASLVARGFADESVDIAEVIGALGSLDALATAEAQRDRVALLLARQAVAQRIMLAMLDVNATIGAIECEDERGDELRGLLQRREARRQRNLGLAGLLVGAGTAVASGALAIADPSIATDVVGIVGGSVEAAIGGAALYSSSSGELHTRSNLLAEIQRRPAESKLFPPTVWRYLTRHDTTGAPSIAEGIVEDWRAAGLLWEGEGEDPLLGPEGRFDTGELERRDAMLDLLEARVALMSGELRALLAAVVARPEAPPVRPAAGAVRRRRG